MVVADFNGRFKLPVPSFSEFLEFPMRKITALFGAATFALATAVASTAFAAPQGFGPGANSDNHGAPRGFNNIQSMTVSQVKQHSYDDQRVSLVGSLTNYFGDDHYEFSDKTGSIMVDLDDDRNWSHIQKGQTIRIFAEVDRDDGHVTLDVKRAQPVR